MAILVFCMGSSSLEARSFRVDQIPNGNAFGCTSCHVSIYGGGDRTAFGDLVLNSFLIGSGNVDWVPDLALADSDGDGFSNGHELEDPFGIWSAETDNPGNPAWVTNPGSSDDTPSGEAAKFSLKMNISQMEPHAGQYFEINIIDVANSTVVASESLASITDPAFEYVFMHVFDSGLSYNVDIWADHNGNGVYDAPPADHSWRVHLSEVPNNISHDFQHSTDFFDIGGPVSLDHLSPQPQDLTLYDAYPNPFNPQTRIRFDIGNAGHVSLDVFNIRGEHVAQLVSGHIERGINEINWSARDHHGEDLPAGLYIYTLRSAGHAISNRMMLLK